MTDTTMKPKRKKPPSPRESSPDDEPEAFPTPKPAAAAAPVVPIEVTLTRDGDAAGPVVRGSGRRVLPMATLAAEATTTGGAGLYAATGVVGAVAAAGVVAAAGLAVGATRAARTARGPRAGRVPRAGRIASRMGMPGVAPGRSPRSATGGGRPGGATSGGGRRAGGTGAFGGGRGQSRAGRGAAASAGGRAAKGAGRSGGGPSGTGFRAGLGAANAAHRLGGSTRGGSRGKTNAGGDRSKSRGGSGLFAGRGTSGRAGEGPRGGGRLAAGRTAAGRAATRGGAAGRRALSQARGAAGRVMSSRAAQAARARAGRAKASAKRAAPHWARSVGAGMAAVGAGALAAVPGLVAAAGGAALGGLGRVLRVGPGARLGLAGLMWGPRAGAWVWRRLIKRARRLRDTARGEGVSTDFTEPTDVGSTTAAPVLAGAHGSRGEAMTKSVFAARAEQVRDTYSRYSPPTMLCVAAEYRGLPDGLRSAAAALGELACATAERFPAHPQVGAAVVATYLHTMQAAEAAEAVDVAFRELHREDLARHETPRNGERMWNIGEHRADGALAFRQSHFAASCEDVRTVYARWAPEKMMQVLAEYEGLPEGLESLAHAIHHLATLSGEAYPVHQDVAEAVAGIGNFLKRAVSSAQEILPIARRLHAVDISHHEAPRPGEDMWDV